MPDPPLNIRETGGGGLASRGVAYWESGNKKRIFLPARDGRLFSIDITTHQPDPEFGDQGFIDLRKGLPDGGKFLFISSSAIYQDLVIQGFGINDSAEKYIDVPLRAYDAHTGKVVCHLIPFPRKVNMALKPGRRNPGKPGRLQCLVADERRYRHGIVFFHRAQAR